MKKFLITLISSLYFCGTAAGTTAETERSVDQVQIVPGKKTLTAKQINDSLAKHTKAFAACFETVTKVNPSQGGTLHVNFFVAANGKVIWARKVDSDLANEFLVDCVLKVVRKSRFPRIRGQQGTEIKSYPFFFHSDRPQPETTP